MSNERYTQLMIDIDRAETHNEARNMEIIKLAGQVNQANAEIDRFRGEAVDLEDDILTQLNQGGGLIKVELYGATYNLMVDPDGEVQVSKVI